MTRRALRSHGMVTSEVHYHQSSRLRNTNILGMEGRPTVCPGSGCTLFLRLTDRSRPQCRASEAVWFRYVFTFFLLVAYLLAVWPARMEELRIMAKDLSSDWTAEQTCQGSCQWLKQESRWIQTC